MPVMNINPTQNELGKLKKRYRLALRGHKLLKDKLDELMRHYLLLTGETKNLRIEVEKEIAEISLLVKKAKKEIKPQIFEDALTSNNPKLEIDVSKKYILNISVPDFFVLESKIIPAFGYAFTSTKMDKATDKLKELTEKMIRLAQYEYSVNLLTKEIISTRRRVNSLEHILIPDLSDTIRYISSRLEEADRSNRIRLIKVKDLVLKNKAF